ncbi:MULTISPECIES: AMP-binding protein [Mycobacterium]|nr:MULTISPECIES: AMP-binding protein [Mycobacterium]BDE12941.1 peptide synthase [Mycobacterium sp. 20KCMC460]GLB91533.1 peptide synthase [Mycobacterium kiyosense]GLC04003.1 peptide synthase [Mycobacterium kiyosense]GLC09997.1 peptide synthase [Mycobacterium kiyosense]GLC15798.1 peptide synthase [Mycobacterium kiyosense]
MIESDHARAQRIPLTYSQRNIYHGVQQDADPSLYLIGKRYRFRPLPAARFLAALEASVLDNPIQLCVLQAAPGGDGFPDLVPRLGVADLVRFAQDDDELSSTWRSGILGRPLVRYTVRTDGDGAVCGMDVDSHHILLDGGATGIIEADLARHLAQAAEKPCATDGLTKVAAAHRREATKVVDALQRLSATVQRELAQEPPVPGGAPVSAGRAVLRESVQICGDRYDELVALSESEHIPLNVLVAAAAVAVDASLHQSTESLVVHAVDNRFGDPELNVATCLVNSVAHPVRFQPFASVADVVAMLDRSYVKAVRRRWLREEQYRRMYLAINRTTGVQALTLNFIRQSCAPQLRPWLTEAPVATRIGPVEGMTVACVQDEAQRCLQLAVWDRADLSGDGRPPAVAQRLADALQAMPKLWRQPIAMTVDDWFIIDADGARRPGNHASPPETPTATAWFTDPAVDRFVQRRMFVRPWVGWLVDHGVALGDVVVCCDDDTDRTIDLLVACHLAGCGYSVCDRVEELPPRAAAITAAGHTAHVVDLQTAALPVLDDARREVVDGRLETARRAPGLATGTAYVMPTSGSTGQPKLVRVTHGSLGAFCRAVRRAYGWGPNDTILQSAPLTSDISVEEIFGAASCGAELVRSAGMKSGELDTLIRDLLAFRVTVADLPTAGWQLLCDDDAALEALSRSTLRQLVVGGEPVRATAIDKWLAHAVAQRISLVSSYGPTETTVVVTYLPITGAGSNRVGRPMLPGSVFTAFGEVVVVGDLVSAGYLGIEGGGFGIVAAADGTLRRAFATADRVSLDAAGFPVFSGRKDAIVKIGGKRVDTAEVLARVCADPAVSDLAVEPRDGRLGVWFQTGQTRSTGTDSAAAARIRLLLHDLGVPSFFVVAVADLPRRPNGKVDSENLPDLPQNDCAATDTASGTAAALAGMWSRQLDQPIRADTSLLAAGVGSVDLIRILPQTRAYLGRPLTLLDLISADTAANLIEDQAAQGWLDAGTAAQIECDLALLRRPQTAGLAQHRDAGSIVVLGASGILGTGFARAVLDLTRSGASLPDVVFAARSALPHREPWDSLRGADRIRLQPLDRFDSDELDALLRGARTVINCVGNTNVLVPYRELRSANVEFVTALTSACTRQGARLVHLSTLVVNADVTQPCVTDPRHAPYPYAAAKSLAELVVTAAAPALDFTLVRLPRVLGDEHQLANSTDIFVSLVDACLAVGAYPALTLTEEITTGAAAAAAIVDLASRSGALGGGLTVLRGEPVSYNGFLDGYGLEEVGVAEWKARLDRSDWARRNPRQWSVLDGWVSLGARLGERSYAQYLSDRPTVELAIDTVAEVNAQPQPLRALLARGRSKVAQPQAV